MNYRAAKLNAINKQEGYTLTGSIKSDKDYTVLMFCAYCGALLITTKVIPGENLKSEWSNIVMGAGFAAPKCPSCNYSTERDINLGTDLLIFEGDHTNDPDIVANNKPSALIEDLRNEPRRD